MGDQIEDHVGIMLLARAFGSVINSFVMGCFRQERYVLSAGRYVLSWEGDGERDGTGWRLVVSMAFI